jgi:hypothetical protein
VITRNTPYVEIHKYAAWKKIKIVLFHLL